MLAGEPRETKRIDGPGSGEEVLPLSFSSNRTELSGVLAWDPASPEVVKERHCTKELQKERGQRGTRVCCLVAEPIPAKGATEHVSLRKECCQRPGSQQQVLNVEKAVV